MANGKIKTRDKVKDIKIFDRAANAREHMKNVAVKSRDGVEAANRQAEETQNAGYSSPAGYASERMSGGAKKIAERTGHIIRQNPAKKASENIGQVKQNVEEVRRQAQNIRNAVEPFTKSTVDGTAARTSGKATAKNTAVSPSINEAAKNMVVKRAQERARRNTVRTRQAAEKTMKMLDKPGKTLKTLEKPGKTIKKAERNAKKGIKTAEKAAKGTVKTAQKGIKTAQATGKVAVKTTQQTVKASVRAAQATARAAKVAAHGAKVTAKAAATAVKVAAKVLLATVKAIITALKALVSAIAAGGWVAIAFILIICLIGLLIGSIFGIFFSGEDSGNGRTMPDAVSQLTTDFYGQIEDIKRDNPHDIVIMDAMAINWRDVLAVYAVKVTTDPENGMEVATLDDAKVELLRGVLDDMVSLSYTVHTETVTPDDGNDETEDEEVEIVILTISMAQKTADEMALLYGFSQTQQAQLHELLDPEYADLWTALIGSGFMGGTGDPGEILPGYPGRAPLSIFSWPLAGGWPVNSPFGWRPDPFDPTKTVYHGGIDVACPAGTPILAAASGTVVVANGTDSWGGTYGYYVKIQHDGTFSTLYAHCSSIAVTNGQNVQKDQVIGYVGSTGSSTGNHLHFEVIAGGTRVDPQGYFG